MKILLVVPPSESNGYITNLFNHFKISTRVEKIERGIEQIWSKELRYNIYHFQWPECIFNWREPSQNELIELNKRIKELKSFAKIVSTMHNEIPHYSNTTHFRELYKIIYSNSDAIIHLGEFSKNKYDRIYPAVKSIIIPHGIYENFPNKIFKDDARKILRISKDDIVFIFVGNIRSKIERDLLLNGFSKFNEKNKKLIILRGNIIWGTFRLFRIINKIGIFIRNKIIWEKEFVSEERMQIFLNAADIMIIPRIKPLNSGNLVLGFTFGKVVIGPDYGNVGEILRKTSNPIFVPDSLDSLVLAMKKARDLAINGKGDENRIYAHRYWNMEIVTEKHLELYKELIASTQ